MNQSDIPENSEIESLVLHGPLRLASAKVECWKCNGPTTVFAIAAADVTDPNFEDYEEQDNGGSFISDIGEDDMPAVLAEPLAGLAPNYRPTYSHTMGATSWANVCEHCGSLQGAFYLHAEPDGPFFGSPVEFDGTLVELHAGDVVVSSASFSM